MLTLFAQCTGQGLELRLLPRVQEHARLELHTGTAATEKVAEGATVVIGQWKNEVVLWYEDTTLSTTGVTTSTLALICLSQSTEHFV